MRPFQSAFRSPGVLLLVAIALFLVACGDGGDASSAGVTVEALPSASATPAVIAVPTGGKPAAPEPTATPEAAPTDVPPAATATAASEPPAATPTEAPPTPATQPATGRWIDVDVTSFVVRLMDGESVVEEIGPVAVGAQVDTGAYLSTQTGLFYVYSKIEGLAYDAPYDTYISHWVGFDPAKDNGFHSFLKDASGAVVDASTGRVSNGCIRTGGAEAIFAWAEIGMPVWVHH